MIVVGITEVEYAQCTTLYQYLAAQPEFDCVLCVGSHRAFLSQLKQLAVPPALVLTTVQRPGSPSLAWLAELWQQLPSAEVVVLSAISDASDVFEALRAGATGYVELNTPLPLLKKYLLQVAAGGGAISPQAARLVARHFYTPPAEPAAAFTAREQQVLRGLAEGLRYQCIADRLFVSLDTIRSHTRQVYRKLHVNSRIELINKLQQQVRHG